MHALRVIAAMVAFGASVAANEPAAATPRVLELCIVDAAQNAAVDAAFQQTFANRIGELASASASEHLRINAQHVGSRDAATRLKSGECDAVLVIGPDRPRALQRIEAVAFAAALGWQRNGMKLYLIVGHNRDARLQELLAKSFRAAVNAELQPERKVALR